jgi:hypothetical protein
MILEYITYHFHFHFPACLCLTYLPTGRCEQKQKCWLRLAYSLIQLRRRLQGSVDLIKCAGGRAVDAISKPDAVVLSEKGRDVIYTYRPDSTNVSAAANNMRAFVQSLAAVAYFGVNDRDEPVVLLLDTR